jgi:hypothetical protein
MHPIRIGGATIRVQCKIVPRHIRNEGLVLAEEILRKVSSKLVVGMNDSPAYSRKLMWNIPVVEIRDVIFAERKVSGGG